jgi:hypothetical protein
MDSRQILKTPKYHISYCGSAAPHPHNLIIPRQHKFNYAQLATLMLLYIPKRIWATYSNITAQLKKLKRLEIDAYTVTSNGEELVVAWPYLPNKGSHVHNHHNRSKVVVQPPWPNTLIR